VHVVGPRQLDAAAEGRAKAGALDHRGGHGEAHEREPGKARQDEAEHEQRERREGDHPHGKRRENPATIGPGPGCECGSRGVRGGEEEAAECRSQHEPGETGGAAQDLVEGGNAEAQHERRQEVAPVELDRLRDELAHRPLRGRERRRQRLAILRHVGER
jgi:hypothetical protein